MSGELLRFIKTTFFLLINLYLLRTFSCSFFHPIIKTESGKVRGITTQTYTGVLYEKFLGVPYAKPPVGKLRFKDPEPVNPWSGTLNATFEKPWCLQVKWSLGGKLGSEDCLYLNIAVPETHHFNKSSTLPVMVWIHGGGFTSWSGTMQYFKPDNFINRNVILVTVYYRLGIFGFLSFEDPEVGIPGNAGLKDQILALKWIQKNIQFFGGDSCKVTLFGSSAGAVAVHLLSLSPLASGLFQRIILQSSTGLVNLAFQARKYLNVSRVVGCDDGTQLEIFRCLRGKTGMELLDAVNTFDSGDYHPLGLSTPFGPVIETYKTNRTVLIEPVMQTILNGTLPPIPAIIGVASHDGGVALRSPKFMKSIPLNFTDSVLDELIPDDVNVQKGTEESRRLGREIKEFYYGNKTPSDKYLFEYINLLTDYHFLVKIFATVRLYKYFSPAPVYFYMFNFLDPLSPWNSVHDRAIVSHADDLAFLFHHHPTVPINRTQYKTGETLISDLWCSFARNGYPSSNILPFAWPPVKGDLNVCLVMERESRLSLGVERGRVKFWDGIYRRYNSGTVWRLV